jgi:dipeptide/tripeptide permease
VPSDTGSSRGDTPKKHVQVALQTLARVVQMLYFESTYTCLMNLSQRWQQTRQGFHPTFWVANVLELFERFAFYGSKAVLTVFLANKVGLADEAGTLAGLFSGVIYSLPIVAGVFVDKYGFKKTLIACFFIFCVGYFLIGLGGMAWGATIVQQVGAKPYMIAFLLLTAVGGSLIKPCIVGTVARTSTDDSRALGFSIYYTLVNIGGAIGPMIAMTVRENIGIEFVLVMSSITSGLLLLGTMLFFNEPQAAADESEKRTFTKVFADMILVFGNLKFILFLVIFSGFWIMFWQIFYLLPFYTTDVLKYDRFEVIETVDAWGVIIFTIPMTALVKKWKPFTAMTIGFLIASVAWIFVGASTTILLTVIGIAIYALGEATQAPRFYEYVSSLAPKDQIGTFMGFAFLPVAIGSFSAGKVADVLRLGYMNTNPSMMWYVVSGIGFGAVALMILYDRLNPWIDRAEQQLGRVLPVILFALYGLAAYRYDYWALVGLLVASAAISFLYSPAERNRSFMAYSILSIFLHALFFFVIL